jgi:hypothetical protein
VVGVDKFKGEALPELLETDSENTVGEVGALVNDGGESDDDEELPAVACCITTAVVGEIKPETLGIGERIALR